MASQSNVIELVMKLTDQVSKPLDELRGKIGELGKFALGAAGVLGFVESMKKVVEVSAAAEDAMSQFDLAFKNLGATSGKTREELVKFADQTGQTSVFDTQSILRAEAVLLQFKSASGQTFDRARKDALDLAAAWRVDLSSAAETIGRVLQRPDTAIRQLRASGVLFTTSQEEMVRSLVDTGHAAEAANVVLSALEKNIKGAADAAANTLSGALTRTKHALDSIFETNTDGMKAAFNSLADTLNDPGVKAGLQNLIVGMAKLVELSTTFGSTLGKGVAELKQDWDILTGKATPLDKLKEQIEFLQDHKATGFTSIAYGDIGTGIFTPEATAAKLHELQQRLARIQGGRSGGDPSSDTAGKALIQTNTAIEESFKGLEEVVVNAQLTLPDFYRQLNKDTETSAEKAGDSFDEIKAKLELLRDSGQITGEQFAARFKEALDDGLDPVIVTVKKRFTKPLQTEFEIALNNMVDDFTTAMDRMLNNGKFTWRELGQYFLHEVEAGIIKRAIVELQQLLANAFKSTASKGGGGLLGGLIGAIFGGITSGGSTVGGGGSAPSTGGKPARAGGGYIPAGGAWVGDDGPEFVDAPGARVWNRRQLAGMGGGGAVINGGDVNITVQGNADKEALGAIKRYVDVGLARQSRETLRILQKTGNVR